MKIYVEVEGGTVIGAYNELDEKLDDLRCIF